MDGATLVKEIRKLETERLIQLLGLGARIVKVLDLKDRLIALPGGRRDKSKDRKD